MTIGILKSTDGGATWTPWQPYQATWALTLSGAGGVKTVLAEANALASALFDGVSVGIDDDVPDGA